MYTPKEINILKKLNSPLKVQFYLDKIPINFENKKDSCSSPRVSLRRKTMHCIEAALFAAAALNFHKIPCYLMDLRANTKDFDHVICLFKKNGKWGAISKSNHAALRYREPVYNSARELAMSCFHEYINDKGDKTLRSFSIPINPKILMKGWETFEKDLWKVERQIDDAKHIEIVPKNLKLRKADRIETVAGKLKEWDKKTGKKIKY